MGNAFISGVNDLIHTLKTISIVNNVQVDYVLNIVFLHGSNASKFLKFHRQQFQSSGPLIRYQ